jgi:hypothetical protein
VLARRQRHLIAQQPARAVAEVDEAQLVVAAGEERRADEDREGERRLRGDERGAHPAAERGGHHPASPGPQRERGRGAPGDERGHHSGSESRQHHGRGAQRERREVEVHLQVDRQREAPRLLEHVDERERAGDPERPADAREQRGLREPLAHDPAARCAQRQAQCHLAFERHEPGEQQQRHVAAADRQQEQRSEQQPRDAFAQAAAPVVAERDDARLERTVGLRVLGRQRGGGTGELGAGARGRRPCGEPSERQHRALAAIREELRVVALPLGHPDVGPFALGDAEEALGHDAHDRARPRAGDERAADHCRVAPEVAAEDAARQQDDVLAAAGVLVGRKGPSQERPQREQVEVAGRHGLASQPLGAQRRLDHESRHHRAFQPLEGAQPLSQVGEVGVGEVGPLRGREPQWLDDREPSRQGEGQRARQQRVGKGQDRPRARDADREAQQHGDRPARAPRPRAHGRKQPHRRPSS